MYTNIIQHYFKLKHYHKHPSCIYITLMYQIPHSIRVQIYAPVKWKLGFISWSWNCSSLLFIVVKPVHISKPLYRGNCRFQGVRILFFIHSGILAFTFIIEFHLSFLFCFVFWFFFVPENMKFQILEFTRGWEITGKSTLLLLSLWWIHFIHIFQNFFSLIISIKHLLCYSSL